MTRYVAFLRGVSPMNAKMPELKCAFEAAGFSNVRTVLSSGNVVFDARSASQSLLEGKLESAMQDSLVRSFHTIVRRADFLRGLLEADPFAAFALPPGAKRIVSFLREPSTVRPAFPIESDGARILGVTGLEVFSVYVPSDKGPVFMKLIEKTFGSNITTRTWETVRKCSVA